MKPAPKPHARAGTPAKPVKAPKPKADLALSLIVLVYSVIMIITPDMQAFDSNGPKFLVLAILNLAAYSYLLTRRDFRTQEDEPSRFFLHPSGFSYLIFLVLCMFSVAKAINASEWVIQMCVTFTIFTSVYILFLVFRKGTVYFRMAALTLAVILLADCATVFYHIGQFVRGQFPTIFEIKSIYANKNILSAAIFVKLPVALWLSIYSTDRLRFLGQAALFCGLLAVLFLSTRAFYLGIMLLTLFYLAFLAWKWYRSREKKYLALAVS